MAFLVLLENLSPVERAVFLLREVFDYDYGAGKIVGETEANCRQIFSRARQHLADRRPRFEVSKALRNQLAERFFAACQDGQLHALEELLAEDVTFYGDGGGKVVALPEPTTGRLRVIRFLLWIFRQVAEVDGRVELAEVNGQPGAMLVYPDGRAGAVMTLDIVDGGIAAVRNVLNPDKLVHLSAAQSGGLRSGPARRTDDFLPAVRSKGSDGSREPTRTNAKEWTMNRPRLDSILLASTDPERLHAWYVAALEPEEDTRVDAYRVLKYGGFYLLIDTRDDIEDKNPDPARVILNFDVADALAVAARLDDIGAEWVAKLEDRDGSLFATAKDPDGNYVQIIQLSEAARAAMAGNT